MSNLKLRLKQLEKTSPSMPLIIITDDGKEYTVEQQQQIDEAKARGQPVKIIVIQTIDSNGEVILESNN